MTETGSLDRRSAVPRLIGDPSDFLIVAGLAGTAREIGHLTDGAPNAFLLAGAMGAATMMGLGLALVQPERRVLVVTGDGELLMSLGALTNVGVLQPPNLAIVCVDNGHYGETGNQLSHTSLGVDLAAIAAGAGIAATRTATTEAEIDAAAPLLRESNGPAFVLLKVSDAPPPTFIRSFDAVESKHAFRRALLGRG